MFYEVNTKIIYSMGGGTSQHAHPSQLSRLELTWVTLLCSYAKPPACLGHEFSCCTTVVPQAAATVSIRAAIATRAPATCEGTRGGLDGAACGSVGSSRRQDAPHGAARPRWGLSKGR